MLETTAEYCPPTHLPLEAAAATAQEILLGASYDGVACASAMSCKVRYVLEWESSVPASPGGECVAPPSPAPTAAPAPWSLSPTTEDSVADSGDSQDSAGSDSGSGAATPGPTALGGEGGGGYYEDVGYPGPGQEEDGSGGGNGSSLLPSPSPSFPGQNFLSQSVVECAEAWANCTTVAANTTYQAAAAASAVAADVTGCIKLETLVGEVCVCKRGRCVACVAGPGSKQVKGPKIVSPP